MMQQSVRVKEGQQRLRRFVTVLATSVSTNEIKEATLQQLPYIQYLVQFRKKECRF